MRILMFGWEFPPRVSGGLGTACYGISRALADLGHEILFVMPVAEACAATSHVRLISAADIPAADPAQTRAVAGGIVMRPVRSTLRPYVNDREYHAMMARGDFRAGYLAAPEAYGEDLMNEVLRYSRAAAAIAARERFDIIHGHDWMTVEAGLAAKRESGRPFVFHVHALEFDRSGEHVNQRIYDIERHGMASADAVIAVSHYTKKMMVERSGVSPDKITVVHNAVTRAEEYDRDRRPLPRDASEQTVLFLGRITFQKGPDYFIEAARKVLKEMPLVTFVMAGAGDMMPRMIERVAELGMGSRFRFTGFLRDDEVEEAFARSDLYVMPSVSEPFGISPLEAVKFDVPVIISKQSGVAEILHHTLKVDFWDIDELANKIIAILKYPPLAGELVEKAREELRAMVWENAGRKIVSVYEKAAPGGEV